MGGTGSHTTHHTTHSQGGCFVCLHTHENTLPPRSISYSDLAMPVWWWSLCGHLPHCTLGFLHTVGRPRSIIWKFSDGILFGLHFCTAWIPPVEVSVSPFSVSSIHKTCKNGVIHTKWVLFIVNYLLYYYYLQHTGRLCVCAWLQSDLPAYLLIITMLLALEWIPSETII